jgi:hypothetical protein
VRYGIRGSFPRAQGTRNISAERAPDAPPVRLPGSRSSVCPGGALPGRAYTQRTSSNGRTSASYADCCGFKSRHAFNAPLLGRLQYFHRQVRVGIAASPRSTVAEKSAWPGLKAYQFHGETRSARPPTAQRPRTIPAPSPLHQHTFHPGPPCDAAARRRPPPGPRACETWQREAGAQPRRECGWADASRRWTGRATHERDHRRQHDRGRQRSCAGPAQKREGQPPARKAAG